jgi:hypothetical protein
MPYGRDVSPGPHGNGHGSDRASVLSGRSGVWLTTVSTVVAVATGMFTLRDQIFPENAGRAQASRGVYEQSVGHVCDAANEAERARARNARRLARRLKRARTTLAQRDAVLDSAKETVVSSEHRLADFRGLDVPGELVAREREVSDAWGRMVVRQRGYAERLDASANRRDLLAAAETLPAMRTALAHDRVTPAAGLAKLGGGHCELEPPIVPQVVTLPNLKRSVNPVDRRSTKSGRTVTPDVEAPTGSSSPPPPQRPPPPPPPLRPDLEPGGGGGGGGG